MSVVHVWSGATTDTSAWVRGKVTGSSTRLAVDTDPGLSAPSLYGPVTPTADGVVSFVASGLAAGTRYYYALEDDSVLDTAFVGSFLTHPVAAGERGDFVFGAAGDAGLTGVGDDSHITSAVSNNPVFDTMREQALAEDWLFFSHLGDLHYRNIGTADTALYRAAYDDTLTFNGTLGASARQGQFLRDVPMTYVWDDHDFGPNNSDRTAAGNATANTVYRERVPHYTQPAADGVHQSWQVGRVLFIASDVRSFRDPNDDPQLPTKTMLGTAQKAWMESVLTANAGGAEALVWIMPSQWMGHGDDVSTDTWDNFMHERAELVTMLGDIGWLRRTVQLTADKHALAISSGPNNPHGGFPVYMLASLDASYSTPQGIYDLGQLPTRQGYGTVRITDSGHTIALQGTGYVNGTLWRSHTAYVQADRPILALDYAAGQIHPEFRPIDDDQKLINDVTASRQKGGEARFVQESGRLSVQPPPDGAGTYDTSVTLNVESDDQLEGQAAWRVHLGTVDEARYPRITVDLAANPELTDQVVALREGDRITVANPPGWLPPGTIEQLAEGSTERIRLHDWRVEFNASPASPWTVAEAVTGGPETAGPDRPNRADTTGSVLARDVGETDTVFVVHTPQDGTHDRAIWVPSAGPGPVFPEEFPFDLHLGGEVVRATSVEPLVHDTFTRTVTDAWGTAESGQAWTTTGGDPTDYDVNGTAATIHLAANPGTLRFGDMLEDVADCELLASFSVDMMPTTGDYLPGVFARGVGADLYWCTLALQPDGQVGIEVRDDTTVVGARTVTTYTYAPGEKLWLRARVIGHRVLGRVWAADAEHEPHAWHVDQTITSSTQESGSLGVAVASTDVSAPTFTIDEFRTVTPQSVTVQRSQNTIVKPHTAAAAVSLAQPANFPL